MQRYWAWLLLVTLAFVVFISIPLSLNPGTNKELLKPAFDEYITKFNKTYKDRPDEYETRFQHFLTSMAEIEKFNAESSGPEAHRAQYGLTMLSDMSKLEYKELHLSDEKVHKSSDEYGRSWNDQPGHHHHHEHEGSVLTRRKRVALPMKVDWRTKGMVGAVRNQGQCGACWAFSTIGMAETMNAIKTAKFTPLSVQEAIDCAKLGNSGCSGGDICLLLDWLTLTGGVIQTDKQYPTTLTEGVCRLKKNDTGVRVTSFTCDSFVGAEDKILSAVASHGPVAVAVNALTWQNYLGGVVQYHCSGTPAELNHAVEIVGYDLTAEIPYYIAKNSWGAEFGNGGYIYLAVGSNICGLANEVATVDVA